MESAPEESSWLLVADADGWKHAMGKCPMAVEQTELERAK